MTAWKVDTKYFAVICHGDTTAGFGEVLSVLQNHLDLFSYCSFENIKAFHAL